MEISFTAICRSLPLIGQFARGCATAVNLAGGATKTVDPESNEVHNYAVEKCEGISTGIEASGPDAGSGQRPAEGSKRSILSPVQPADPKERWVC